MCVKYQIFKILPIQKNLPSFPEIHLGPHLNSVFSKISRRFQYHSSPSSVLAVFFSLSQPGMVRSATSKNCWPIVPSFLKDFRRGLRDFLGKHCHCKTRTSPMKFEHLGGLKSALFLGSFCYESNFCFKGVCRDARCSQPVTSLGASKLSQHGKGNKFINLKLMLNISYM